MAETNFDLIVMGGGPGGYVAAIRAAQLGMKAAVVEREHLGGICLNWGCIPTKALLRTSEIYHYMNHAGDYGLSAKDVGYDVGQIVQALPQGGQPSERRGSASPEEEQGRGVRRPGPARRQGRRCRKVDVSKDGKSVAGLTAKHVILATGARARQLPGLESDGKLVWTYKEAMVPEAMPKSLLVIGSGAIGIEFASFYRTMGAEVTVVEVRPRILPVEDEEVSAFAHKAFEKQA